MVSINVTRMSSKGQIVIPSEMREGLEEGDEFLIIKDNERIILKKAERITERMKEDLEFAKRTESAWKEIDNGNYTSYTKKEFLKELEKW